MKSKFGENEHGSKSKFEENEEGSNYKFGENFVQNCASCNYQIHESQTVYMYNDQCFCCHRCRAKVMSVDRVQTYADCHKEIIPLSNTEKPEEHTIATSKNEVGSKSKFREKNIRRCASCDYQMHQCQIVYVYNDQCFCRHRCRAKVMALDRVQTYAATPETIKQPAS
ncbi:hypothetical protein ABFS83_02G105000 [Erythranthe nasuta]